MARNQTKRTGATAPIRGYDNWTVGELRQKLARRSAEELKELLKYEKSTRSRKGAVEAIERVLSDVNESSGSRGKKGSSGRGSQGRSSEGRGEGESGGVVEMMKGGVRAGMQKVRELVGMPAEQLGTFEKECFMERLSEFLEHERNGAKLYELGLEKEGVTEEQRERLQEFFEQTRRHIDILTTIITALGGDPEELSEPAKLNRTKAEGLLEADTDGEGAVLNFFQNLMIAEFVDHQNWSFLKKAKGMIDDEEVSQVLDEHVEDIEGEEDEHYRWAMKQVENLSVLDLFSGGAEEAEESGEDEREEGGSDEEAA